MEYDNTNYLVRKKIRVKTIWKENNRQNVMYEIYNGVYSIISTVYNHREWESNLFATQTSSIEIWGQQRFPMKTITYIASPSGCVVLCIQTLNIDP